MPNRRKTERNEEIIRLYDDRKGLLQREIADKLGMKEGAVSMVIVREKRRQAKEEQK